MIERTIHFFQKESSIWGPISLLCTLAIGAKTSIPFDLLFLSLAGLYLCARFQMRGCCYALALLGITAAFKHAFLVSDHLWQLGVEGSLGLAFFISALAFEQGALFLESLNQQMETRSASLANLEEDLVKVQETTQAQQIAFQEKITTLQKELEELQSDHSSILILNEVLRKTTARHSQESTSIAASAQDQAQQMAILRAELDEARLDLARVANTEAVAIQNTELMAEINAIRYAKEQTHLISETLARLHIREAFKAKEAEQEAADLAAQLAATKQEVERVAIPLQEQLAASHNEIQTLNFQFEKTFLEAEQGRLALQKLNEVQSERNFLRERLQAAMEEISLVQQQKPQVDPHIAEQLEFAKEKMTHLSQMEPLFKQLKKQFDEKNQILHETRSNLFVTDTELQRLKMEKAALELNPLPKEVERELEDLGEQVIALEEENQELQELISVLTDTPSDAAKRKKKLKTQSPPEQDFLF